MNFIGQLKINATTQLTEHWAQRWSGGNTPELFFEPEVQPPRYSSMSPMLSFEDFSMSRVADEECGTDEFLAEINPTQATWAPIRNTKPKPNDGLSSLQSSSMTILDKHSTGYDSENCAQYPPWYKDGILHQRASQLMRMTDDGPLSFNHSPSSTPALLGFTGQKLTKNQKSDL